MFRRFVLWAVFAGCLAVVLAAMGWISLTAVRLERAERDARRQALVEERVRLALWRMDSALTPLLAQESARPDQAYQAFVAAGRPAGLPGLGPSGSLWTPSPLLTTATPQVLLYFEIAPDGRVSSPQVPAERFQKLLRSGHIDQDRVKKAAEALAQWRPFANRGKLIERLPPQPATAEPLPLLNPAEQGVANSLGRSNWLQRKPDAADFGLRNETVQSLNRNAALQSQRGVPQEASAAREPRPSAATAGWAPMTPLWIDGRLVLARRVTTAGGESVQGCLLDWPSLRTSLLTTIGDLLPMADLQPVRLDADVDGRPVLAALPLQLAPGHVELVDDGVASPIVLSLTIAWACVLTAALAVAALLWGVVRLSSRRASFVSAVTHELRTPLTTFRLYAEMLAEGMVPDAARQREYLVSLRREADRLAHLVENVLSYARLERGRGRGALEPVTLSELIDRAEQRLTAHAEQAGMTLVVEGREAAAGAMVMANLSMVEQVLLNLVDNACKYAAGAADKRIHLEAISGPREAGLAIRDHGPGLTPPARRRMFRSFSKSARQAAESAPGIGLGLTLSRRLARDMGGDLRLDRAAVGGTRFVIELKSAC
ncbi:MAG: HAMP domain-containing sensor histidine kinase [Thermoguttaceae bacterium]